MTTPTESPFHRPKRVRWLNVALGCGIALSAPAVIGMATYISRAWGGKENVADHAADMRTLRSELAISIDSVRMMIAIDSTFSQRILDAVCTNQQGIRACRP